MLSKRAPLLFALLQILSLPFSVSPGSELSKIKGPQIKHTEQMRQHHPSQSTPPLEQASSTNSTNFEKSGRPDQPDQPDQPYKLSEKFESDILYIGNIIIFAFSLLALVTFFVLCFGTPS